MKVTRDSKTLRQDYKLLRNDFNSTSMWGMPIIKKEEIELANIKLLGVDKIRISDQSSNILKTVHFFVEDNKAECYYNNPGHYIARLAQYSSIITPDFSLYTDMPLPIQMMNVFKSRWCGAYWQEHGITVIPSISWSTEKSYDFCFEGIELKSTVVISTLGCMKNKNKFMKGYKEMMKRIDPKRVICFGDAFIEMGNDVVVVDYLASTGRRK